MKVKFFGAAHEVGRSCIMIEDNSTKILLDCGVKLGEKEEYPIISDEELKSIDAIIISHAHLDHMGYLPHVFSTGWKGFVYTTKPTFELSNVLISDYMKISNPKNVTKEGLSRLQRGYKIVEYHKEFSIKGLKVKLLPAGHILGSALTEVEGNGKRVLYTGDVNLRKTRLLDGAYTEHLHADALITESTYSGEKDIFPPERSQLNAMLASIKETINKGGKIIVPSFAVGRAQEVLFVLDDYIHSGLLQKVPIYVDGMINKAMRIHRHNVIYCRDELQKRILMSEDDPFKSDNFYPIDTRQKRSKVMNSQEACIIVTTSGMITGGPVMKYIEKLAGNELNKLILVGYQAEGTGGRALADGAKELTINGRKVKINMSIEQYHLSAHADRPQLERFIGSIKGLRKIFIVHGEQGKSEELAKAMSKHYETHVPTLGAEFEI
ncbi:MAG: MBL fold metallo-hydrolase RNA specificity domain-containing protein [Candidatus Micrarchaeia archaeon]